MSISGTVLGAQTSRKSLLRRLRQNTAGNILPLAAAAVIPVMGLIGAAVDIGRTYIVKGRLQQACDAGALAARRAMSGNTLETSHIAEGQRFFDFNFPAGTHDTGTTTRTYTPGSVPGSVIGVASTTVNTTIFKVFGVDTMSLSTDCSSLLNVPNTDVMFVLDTSGSMASTISGDTQSKIAALRQAVKDFYVELGAGSTSGAGRIRYGFVPYSSNVNVGKLLPTEHMASSASYRTRVPTTAPVWTWEATGSESPSAPSSYGAYAPTSRPTNSMYTNVASFSSTWSDLSSGTGTVTASLIGGATSSLTRTISGATSGNCADNNTLTGAKTLRIVGDTPGTNGAPTSSWAAPTYSATPPSSQSNTYTQARTNTVTGYRYRWFSSGGTNACRLESSPGLTSGTNTRWSQSQTGTTSRPIAWSQVTEVTGWSNQQATVDISGFKNGSGASWNNSANLAGLGSSSITRNRSGSASSSSISVVAPLATNWSGCVEEAPTINTIVPSSAWLIPAEAKDMKHNHIPTTETERWRPHLADIVYDSTNGQWQGQVSGWQSSGWSVCPGQARRLESFTGDVVAGLSTSFASYVDGLPVVGGTQHDIGMIWGSRFISPDGIYSAQNSNASAPGGFAVSRHIVFMTDGAMDARNQNYGPWGISRLDGRQVPTNALDIDDSNTQMNDVHYRRMEMICNEAKNQGMTVWVVAFGLTTMPETLKTCASDSEHWSLSSNSTALKAKFKAIAETIGGLRLSK